MPKISGVNRCKCGCGTVIPLFRTDVKPPYRVPSMAEIIAVPPNGLTVASTFSGCGGSSLGYRMAGFKVLWASEFVEAARDSYRANMAAGTILDDRDIRTVKPEQILKACRIKRGQIDLLDGSPPCASFSTAGKRQEGWGKEKRYSDTVQRTDDLFFEFVRILKGLAPRSFVAENVSGLVKGTAKGYFLEILAALKSAGYRVRCRVLDAQWLGVPQQRQRTIFVGVREDLVDGDGVPIEPCHPSPLPHRYSVREAIPWIASVTHDSGGLEGVKEYDVDAEPLRTVRAAGGGNQMRQRVTDVKVEQGANVGFGKEAFKSVDEPSATLGTSPSAGNGRCAPGTVRVTHNRVEEVTERSADDPAPSVRARRAAHLGVSRTVEPEADMTGYAVGAEADKLGPGEQSERYFSLVRAPLDGACPTVTADGGTTSLASVVHPVERRKFTIAELRRICGMPDDLILTGSYAAQWERLGRAVPSVMMAWIARAVRDGVLRRADGLSPWEHDLPFIKEALRHVGMS